MTMTFEEDLQTLELLQGLDDMADAFGLEYERLLPEVKALGNRAEKERLAAIFYRQLFFLMRRHLELQAELGENTLANAENKCEN